MEGKFDFSGYCTRNNILCSDGRTIKPDAFKHDDGNTVPLVWNHQHGEVKNVVGNCVLENRKDGVYAYGTFNNTPGANDAKETVRHGDVKALSIYANRLKQNGNDVIHGRIREVSLVLAGANDGAFIDVVLEHSADSEEGSEAYIWMDDELTELQHADPEEGEAEKTGPLMSEVYASMNEDQKTFMYTMIAAAVAEATGDSGDDEAEHSDLEEDDESEPEEEEDLTHSEDGEQTVSDVYDAFTDTQKDVVHALIAQAIDEYTKENEPTDPVTHSDIDEKETTIMKKGIFDKTTNTTVEQDVVLTHSEQANIFADGKRLGSLKAGVLEHSITNIDFMFPDAKTVGDVPGFIKRDTGWVDTVMGSVHTTKFSRIKSIFADITPDAARAKGYIKGNRKTEEVFGLLKRVTTPQTVYKKQKLDRDDLIDIVDFEVVGWLKAEMRMMLDEELARAFLIGDGRSAVDEDKINPDHIRPIWTDDDLYTVKAPIPVAAGATLSERAKNFIYWAIKIRKEYKGSGNPTLFTTEDVLTDCLLLEDTLGHKLYKSAAELAIALRVKEIVTVPVMENQTRTVGAVEHELAGIIVNLYDYNVGADKGGAVNMFDDFDIDYNQMKYLIETRCSGALIKPYSAIALEFVPANP